MPVDTVLERYAAAWRVWIGLLRRRHLFAPFLLIFAAKVIPLVLVFWYWRPPFSFFMPPIIESLWGEPMLHYPEHIESLAITFRLIEIVVMLAIGFAALGWAVFLLVDAIGGRRYRMVKYGGEIAILVPQILLIGLLFVLGVLGVPYLFDWIADQFDRPKLELLLRMAGRGGGFAVEVLLIYSLFFLREVRGNSVNAVKESVKFARENLWVTALLVGTALLMVAPFDLMARDAGALLVKLQGEMVFVYLLLGAVVEVFSLFFLMASTTWLAMVSLNEE
jgi:hypothetical protein